MAQAPSVLLLRFASPVVAKIWGLEPVLPSVPAPLVKLTVVPAARVKLLRVKSPMAYRPVELPLAATVIVLAPWAAVTAPTVSDENVLARPTKEMPPPRSVMGAASLMRSLMLV